MTYKWLFHVKIRFRPALLDSGRLTFNQTVNDGVAHSKI